MIASHEPTRTLILGGFLLIAASVVFGYELVHTSPQPVPIGCTQEAMQCPDGSYVGRTGPNCEFAPCPIVGSPTSENMDTSDWKTYRNEEYGFEMNLPDFITVIDEKNYDGWSLVSKDITFQEPAKDDESYRYGFFILITTKEDAKRQDMLLKEYIPVCEELCDNINSVQCPFEGCPDEGKVGYLQFWQDEHVRYQNARSSSCEDKVETPFSFSSERECYYTHWGNLLVRDVFMQTVFEGVGFWRKYEFFKNGNRFSIRTNYFPEAYFSVENSQRSDAENLQNYLQNDSTLADVIHAMESFKFIESETNQETHCTSNNDCRCKEFTGAGFTDRTVEGTCDITKNRCERCLYY